MLMEVTYAARHLAQTVHAQAEQSAALILIALTSSTERIYILVQTQQLVTVENGMAEALRVQTQQSLIPRTEGAHQKQVQIRL